LYASLLLVPRYVLTSIVRPFMGRLSDKRGSRLIATLDIVFMLCAIGVYFTLNANPNLHGFNWVDALRNRKLYVLPRTQERNHGKFARRKLRSVSGLSMTLGNLRTLTSYVLAITVSSLSVPRYVAFKVFLRTVNLIGGLAQTFLQGIHTALIVSIAILGVALVLSRRKEKKCVG
jgi:nitrate/nitrite transporter NarK